MKKKPNLCETCKIPQYEYFTARTDGQFQNLASGKNYLLENKIHCFRFKNNIINQLPYLMAIVFHNCFYQLNSYKIYFQFL